MTHHWQQIIEEQIKEFTLSDRDEITLDYEEVVKSWIAGHIGVYQVNPTEVLKFVTDKFPFMEDVLPPELEVKLIKAQFKERVIMSEYMIRMCFAVYLDNPSDTFDLTTYEFIQELLTLCKEYDATSYSLICELYPEFTLSEYSDLERFAEEFCIKGFNRSTYLRSEEDRQQIKSLIDALKSLSK